jgi:hypothetical protein
LFTLSIEGQASATTGAGLSALLFCSLFLRSCPRQKKCAPSPDTKKPSSRTRAFCG